MYHIYLPSIQNSIPIYKGIALAEYNNEDLSNLHISWYYDWGDTLGNNKVPMLWNGNISKNIPKEYDKEILFLNEPNLKNQSNLTPEEAVDKYKIVRNYYSKAKIIGCGISSWATNWMILFLDLLGDSLDKYHIHAYVEDWITVSEIKKQLTLMHNLTGGEYWITEFNIINGDLNQLKELIGWFQSQKWIERIAIYTNRQKGESWNLDKKVELVNPDSSLTELGKYYKGV